MATSVVTAPTAHAQEALPADLPSGFTVGTDVSAMLAPAQMPFQEEEFPAPIASPQKRVSTMGGGEDVLTVKMTWGFKDQYNSWSSSLWMRSSPPRKMTLGVLYPWTSSQVTGTITGNGNTHNYSAESNFWYRLRGFYLQEPGANGTILGSLWNEGGEPGFEVRYTRTNTPTGPKVQILVLNATNSTKYLAATLNAGATWIDRQVSPGEWITLDESVTAQSGKLDLYEWPSTSAPMVGYVWWAGTNLPSATPTVIPTATTIPTSTPTTIPTATLTAIPTATPTPTRTPPFPKVNYEARITEPTIAVNSSTTLEIKRTVGATGSKGTNWYLYVPTGICIEGNCNPNSTLGSFPPTTQPGTEQLAIRLSSSPGTYKIHVYFTEVDSPLYVIRSLTLTILASSSTTPTVREMPIPTKTATVPSVTPSPTAVPPTWTPTATIESVPIPTRTATPIPSPTATTTRVERPIISPTPTTAPTSTAIPPPNPTSAKTTTVAPPWTPTIAPSPTATQTVVPPNPTATAVPSPTVLPTATPSLQPVIKPVATVGAVSGIPLMGPLVQIVKK